MFIAGSSFPLVLRKQLRKTDSGDASCLVEPGEAAEDHDDEHGCGSERQPAGVGADVSGLDAADERAEAFGACACGHAGGLDEEAFDAELEAETGEHEDEA